MCFSLYLGVLRGGGGLCSGLGHNLLVQFSIAGSSEMEISEIEFLDIRTIYNDKISYVKHVLDPLCLFFTLFGCWRGGGGGAGSKGAGHNLLMQLSTLCWSKTEISEFDFFFVIF